MKALAFALFAIPLVAFAASLEDRASSLSAEQLEAYKSAAVFVALNHSCTSASDNIEKAQNHLSDNGISTIKADEIAAIVSAEEPDASGKAIACALLGSHELNQ